MLQRPRIVIETSVPRPMYCVYNEDRGRGFSLLLYPGRLLTICYKSRSGSISISTAVQNMYTSATVCVCVCVFCSRFALGIIVRSVCCRSVEVPPGVYCLGVCSVLFFIVDSVECVSLATRHSYDLCGESIRVIWCDLKMDQSPWECTILHPLVFVRTIFSGCIMCWWYVYLNWGSCKWIRHFVLYILYNIIHIVQMMDRLRY